MARRQKTKAEHDQERADTDRRVWEEFRPKLEALHHFADALKLVNEAPPPNSPGRRYYSNLGFFLQAFSVPAGSSYSEKALYLALIQRMDAAGELKLGVGQQVEEALRSAMAAQGNW